jgi:hypothetical protein
MRAADIDHRRGLSRNVAAWRARLAAAGRRAPVGRGKKERSRPGFPVRTRHIRQCSAGCITDHVRLRARWDGPMTSQPSWGG